VRISAKADYAVRAAVELATSDGPVKGDHISQSQDIPLKFLENILIEMRHAGLVRSQRGREGGYWLARDPDDITIADVVRAVEGPLAHVRGEPPEEVHYAGPAEALEDVWIAVRANLRAVLEHVTVADVASGSLPREIVKLAKDPDAWAAR
jgi:Rrf2 family protein